MTKEDKLKSEVLFNETLADVEAQFSACVHANNIVIGACLSQERYDELLKTIFKAGYLAGMKFTNRNKLT